MQVLARQLPFWANRNAELAVPSLFWPVNCAKIGRNVALLSGATVYSLYCAACIGICKLSVSCISTLCITWCISVLHWIALAVQELLLVDLVKTQHTREDGVLFLHNQPDD